MKPTDLTPEESQQWDHTVEFEMDYCRHYEPKPGMKAKDLDCALGIDRKTLPEIKDKGQSRWPMPCIDGHLLPGGACAICPKWERHSQEDGEKRALGVLHSLRKMTLAGPVVAAWRKKPPREDHLLSVHGRIGEGRLLPPVKDQLLEEAAVHVGRILRNRDRDDVFVIALFDALHSQAGQVQHRAAHFGLRDHLFNA